VIAERAPFGPRDELCTQAALGPCLRHEAEVDVERSFGLAQFSRQTEVLTIYLERHTTGTPQAQGATGRALSKRRAELLHAGHQVFPDLLPASSRARSAPTCFWTSITSIALSSRLLSLSLSRVSCAIC
jgi:hypothetical protein